ncbi:MAG: ribosomal-processing cysteine protease Prp [Butyribacter sp.]|nr:ribosomal-processing cysteine protease Prp [bacterium]MDY3853432.1 ribosomal-processing cysteine protease Prp [Butyribacter sp.]
MIQVTIYQNVSGKYCGFRMEGHAEYAQYGKDIVCAAVSALVINTINSIEAFTEDTFETSMHQEKDVVSFLVKSNPISEKSELLLDSLVFGIENIAKEYGKKYIHVKIKRI